MTPKLENQPQTVAQAVVLAEAHLRSIGQSHLSPLTVIREHSLDQNDQLVTAAVFPSTVLREKELLPGLKLRSGSSIIEIVRIIPTNKEVVYKNNRGGLFRMPSEKFVRLAKQQGYRKVWGLSNLLLTLKNLLKPVLDAVPLMWVLKFIVDFIRKKPRSVADRLPKPTDKIHASSAEESHVGQERTYNFD